MLLPPDLIKLRLKALGVRADKYLGQHFLIDSSVLATIETRVQNFTNPEEIIIEIGPGLGVLTSRLITLPNQIIAIEKDPVFAGTLKPFLDNPKNLTVITGDALKELQYPKSKAHQLLGSRPWSLVANIPYAITSPLLRIVALSQEPPQIILVLVQREVAERVCARPGNPARGLLSVQLEINYESEIIRKVAPSAFWPQPQVESALLLLTLRPHPLVKSREIPQLLGLVAAGFSGKRKKLHNSLSGSLGLTTETMKTILEKAGIDPSRRAETLNLEEWSALNRVLQKMV